MHYNHFMRVICLLITFLLSAAFSNVEFQKKNKQFIELLEKVPIIVVAPASYVDDKSLAQLKNATSLKLKIADECFGDKSTLFHGNSDASRFKCLKDALLDSSNIVWALRGGYGSAKLIPELQQLVKPSKEKFFIGFSDITALHIFLSQEWGWKTIHGNGIIEILKTDKDRSNFIKIANIISGKQNVAIIDGLRAMNSVARSNRTISGRLTGGNLTMVQTSIGTNWQIKTKSKILFLEDVSVKPYHIDRMLLHLKQAGLLQNVSAIIFGSFDSDDNAILAVLSNFASNTTIPVFKTNRFGHSTINDPIIYNTDSSISPSSDNRYTLKMKI